MHQATLPRPTIKKATEMQTGVWMHILEITTPHSWVFKNKDQRQSTCIGVEANINREKLWKRRGGVQTQGGREGERKGAWGGRYAARLTSKLHQNKNSDNSVSKLCICISFCNHSHYLSLSLSVRVSVLTTANTRFISCPLESGVRRGGQQDV